MQVHVIVKSENIIAYECKLYKYTVSIYLLLFFNL